VVTDYEEGKKRQRLPKNKKNADLANTTNKEEGRCKRF
jgi:hypothetical protein